MKQIKYLDLKSWSDERYLTHSTCVIDGKFWDKYCHHVGIVRRRKWKSKWNSSKRKLTDGTNKSNELEGGEDSNQDNSRASEESKQEVMS